MRDTQRCWTCRFWDREREVWTEDLYGSTDNPVLPSVPENDWRACKRPDWERPEHTTGGHARMQLHAADEFALALLTAPDFGCTEWQPVKES